MNIAGKRVVVYGAGVSGLSAYQLVREHGGHAVIYDDNPDKPHSTSCTSVFSDCDVIVLSPGVASGNPFVLDAKLSGKTVVSELELASTFCAAEQIAVTGTNGKTTTTLLIDHILKTAKINSHAVGNIGAAFSSIADKLDAMETVVVEASSFQLESAVNFSPDIAVILNITPDHLDRHGSFKRYISAKSNIFLKQSECDKIVFNTDDENIVALEPAMVAEKIPFSVSHPVDGAYVSSGFVCYKGKPVVETAELDFRGRELENVLAAVAVTASKGISFYTIAAGLMTFKRPDFRRKACGTVGKIKVFNDSKATNVFSTVSASESMEGDTVLILGGAQRAEDFDDLFGRLPDKIKGAVVVGENAESIISAAHKAGFNEISRSFTLEDAAADAVDLAEKLDCENVLFSPSSKSYDNYTSYYERGRAFDAVIFALAHKQ